MKILSIFGWLISGALLFTSACGSPERGQDEADGVENERMPSASGAGTILRLDSRFDALVPAGAIIEKVADGFVFLEGPVWIREESRLLFRIFDQTRSSSGPRPTVPVGSSRPCSRGTWTAADLLARTG